MGGLLGVVAVMVVILLYVRRRRRQAEAQVRQTRQEMDFIMRSNPYNQLPNHTSPPGTATAVSNESERRSSEDNPSSYDSNTQNGHVLTNGHVNNLESRATNQNENDIGRTRRLRGEMNETNSQRRNAEYDSAGTEQTENERNSCDFDSRSYEPSAGYERNRGRQHERNRRNNSASRKNDYSGSGFVDERQNSKSGGRTRSRDNIGDNARHTDNTNHVHSRSRGNGHVKTSVSSSDQNFRCQGNAEFNQKGANRKNLSQNGALEQSRPNAGPINNWRNRNESLDKGSTQSSSGTYETDDENGAFVPSSRTSANGLKSFSTAENTRSNKGRDENDNSVNVDDMKVSYV